MVGPFITPEVFIAGRVAVTFKAYPHFPHFTFQGEHNADIQHGPLHHIRKIQNGAADSVQLVDNDPQHLPFANLVKQFLELGLVGVLPRIALVLENFAAAAFQLILAEVNLALNLPFYGKISANIISHKLFFRTIYVKKGGLPMKAKVTRREARKHLEQFHLAVELVKVIKHFFPDLIRLLKQTEDPRNQSYITYPNVILLMTRILSSIFYISSMRKTSQKFNSDTVIQCLGNMRRKCICG